MERDEILARIREAKGELDRAVAAIPEDRMETPGPGGVWSPKDQLSHLAAWHEVVLARMRGGVEEAEIEFPAGYADMDIDDVNRFLFERDRGRTLTEARQALARTYAEVIATVASLSDEKLRSTFRPELPERLLEQTIAGNTYEHYEEHIPMLLAAAGAEG